MARAWPISFCAIDEKATSSSRSGAIPVHSESRQPRTSSSSAIASNERMSCSFTGLLQLLFQRVAVDSVVVPVQLVDELVDLDDRLARDDPERSRLAAAAVLLARVHVGELAVGCLHGPRVLQRLAFPLLPEDLVNHAASASTT